MHTRSVTPLQNLVIDRLAELDMTYREAAARSGGLISHGSINYIALGHSNVSGITPKTIRGLALALDLPVSRIEEAVVASGGVKGTEFKLPKKADKLSPAQRKAVLAFVNALLDNSSGK